MQPPATLLEGASGAGKTSSLVTYINAGLELFVICTEPGGHESLIDACTLHKADLNKLHWCYAMPETQGWSGLVEMANAISTKDFETLAKTKTGIGKDKTRPAAMRLLGALENFKCERTGKEFGDFTKFDDKCAFALDSLSGLSVIAWALTVGHKPTAHMGEWSIAMNFINDLVMKLTTDRNCFFTMTAHVEKEENEITGVRQIMASTLGKKLAPKLPRFFSEVVYAQRTTFDPKFRWSTIDASADLKNRALPVGDKLAPSFLPIVQAYELRKKTLADSVPPASELPAPSQGLKTS